VKLNVYCEIKTINKHCVNLRKLLCIDSKSDRNNREKEKLPDCVVLC